ncbi:MAG: helix-turn-helix transcriptional regulator [Ruminococcaceae bacterium]|nr:helix-turn-helix transcriptional regulator [Oscillospiraceae bacterium]
MSMPTYQITIADKIKAYRKQHNLSQKEFGNLIGVSAQAVCKWEQGICCPDIIFLPQLARILNCTTDAFFEKHGEDTQS